MNNENAVKNIENHLIDSAARERFHLYFENVSGKLPDLIESVDEQIGGGPNSDVFKGRRTETGDFVIIKVLKLDPKRNRAEIEKKVDFLKSLNYPLNYQKYRGYEEHPWKHPLFQSLISYIPGYDVFRKETPKKKSDGKKTLVPNENYAYLIMDYIAGRSLDQILKESGPRPQDRVLDWGCEILWALSYMHRHGYVHGKVRLSHIILRDPQVSRHGERIALVDYDMPFGGEIQSRDMPNVRNFERLAEEFPSTEEGKEKREQWKKKGVRRDVYCTGYLMFRLLTDKEPESFIDLNGDASSLSEEQRAAQAHDLAALREAHALSVEREKGLFGTIRRKFQTAAADRVNRVILKALAQDGYQTADEMLDGLYALPTWDFGNVLRWTVCLTAAVASVLLLLCATRCKDLGQWQKARMERMDRQAAASVKARSMGDYTSAWELALQAVEPENGKALPPVTPAAQSTLAKASGVYDPTKGYKPQYSVVLRGQLVSAEFSPDGSRIAVLVNDTSSRVPEKLLQILDAANGKDLIQPISLGVSSSVDVKFLNGTEMFCVSATESTVYDLETGARLWNVSYPGDSAAASGDGKTVASANWAARTVRIYDAQSGAVLKELSLRENAPPQEDGNKPSNLTLTGRVLALDRDGEHLAVTVDSGETLFFTRTETEWKSDSLYSLDDIGLNPEFLRVEGGFVGNYFFYCFSASLPSGVTRSVCGRVNASQPTVLDRPFYRMAHNEMHISVAENGCYLSIDDQLLFMGEDATDLRGLLPSTDGVIRFLRHHDQWILLGTERSFVVIYEDADSYTVTQFDTLSNTWEVTRDPETDFQLSAVSSGHLLLGSHKSDILTVLGWREETGELAFSYGEDADSEDSEGHIAVYLCSDGQSAIVARSNAFRIVGGETDEPIPFSRRPFRLLYLRDPERPESEVLQAVYQDGTSERFFAKSGKMDGSPSPTTQFVTASYRIDQPSGLSKVEVYNKNDADISAPVWSDAFKGELVRASQAGNYLILSLRADGRPYSVMLNEKFETVAEMECDCDAMPDGTLIFDAGRGNLRKGKVYTVGEMRTLAEENEGQVMGW